MLVERRRVSRKTPGDGKLEISPEMAARLRERAEQLQVRIGAASARGTLVSMTCACGGDAKTHLHHFVESPLLRELEPERDVTIEVGGSDADVIVTP